MEGQYHEREEKGGSRVRKKRDMLVLPGDEIRRTTTEPSFMLHCSLSPSFSCLSLRSKDKRRGRGDRRTRQENKRRKSVVLLSFPLLLSLSISSSLLRVLMSLFFSIDWHKIRDKIGNQSQERETVGPVIDEEKKECFWHETRGKRVKLMRIN